MQNLQSLLVQSYAQHPKFTFGEPALSLSPSAADALNATYERVRASSNQLDAGKFAELRQQCVQRLADIFSELQEQTQDRFEVLFLEELHVQCAELLGQELDHHHASPASGSAAQPHAPTHTDVARLRNDRYYFGELSPKAVKQILDISADDLVLFRENAKAGRLTREDLSLNAGPKIRKIRRILNGEYKRLGVLKAVSEYMRRPMTVTGLALELSVPKASWWNNSFDGLSRAPMTLYAHLDESIKFPKSIVYLSEVDRKNGPTSCYLHAYEALSLTPLQEIVGRVLGNVGNNPQTPLAEYYKKQYHQSMSSEHFRQHFMRLPLALRFNSHFGWDVVPDTDAERFLAGQEHFMLGAAGTYIIFDGARLLHRGGMVQEKDRIALQVIFSDATLVRRIAAKVRRLFA